MKVNVQQPIGVKVSVSKPTNINTVLGIQGPEGPQGASALANFHISQALDVDVSNLTDGSLLIYSTDSDKWVANTNLDSQAMDCGEY